MKGASEYAKLVSPQHSLEHGYNSDHWGEIKVYDQTRRRVVEYDIMLEVASGEFAVVVVREWYNNGVVDYIIKHLYDGLDPISSRELMQRRRAVWTQDSRRV